MNAAVVPVKSLISAKSRLEGVLTQKQRQNLTLWMLDHVLELLLQCHQIGRVYLACPDNLVAAHVSSKRGLLFLPDAGDLNKTASSAAQQLSQQGVSSMLFLHGDLPLLCAQDLEDLFLAARDVPVVLMPDRHGTGTNGLLSALPLPVPTCFGAQSLHRHTAALQHAGVPFKTLRTAGFGSDIDTPQDLQELLYKSARASGI